MVSLILGLAVEAGSVLVLATFAKKYKSWRKCRDVWSGIPLVLRRCSPSE